MNLLDNIAILIFDVNLDIALRMKLHLTPFDITPEQSLILVLLSEREGMSQNDIAKQLNKDKSSMTRMMTSLENKNLIRRVVFPDDRRYYKISLTKEGVKISKSVTSVVRDFINQVHLGLTVQEVEELRRLLTKVRTNVLD